MNVTVKITDLSMDLSYYQPGQPVKLSAAFQSSAAYEGHMRIVLSILSLTKEIHSETRTISLSGQAQVEEFVYQPPIETPRGYGVEVKLLGPDDRVLTTDSTAFDVLENWTQNPRYGFLTDFYPGRTDARETMALLNHYHINGLQFYDWMYRHEQFLTTEDPYYDQWSPKPKSIVTVKALIEAAHQYGMAAIPYTAVYGSSRAYALQHPEMVLYNNKGEMYAFGGDKMMIMDPRPGSPWTTHILEQYKLVLDSTGFDGIHIDQYGDPKVGFDQQGNRYDLAPALAEFVNQTKALTDQYSPKDAVVFNLVTNWPVEQIAPSREDFVYIEVWEPHTRFANLHQLIVIGQKLGGGKPVVLACYIDPRFENNAILNEATIFASGGGHVELGENNGMLSEAYFPGYKSISDGLSATLRDYYDFSVRYQNVTGPSTTDVSAKFQPRIKIPGVSSSLSQLKDTIWPIVRESRGRTAINLINFLGIEQTEWNKRVPNKPKSLQNFQMNVDDASRRVMGVWYATPDQPEIHHALEFKQEAGKITFTVPSLEYWSMIVIEWAD